MRGAKDKIPGKTLFQGTTRDTKIVVTDEMVAASPVSNAAEESSIEFMLPLNEIQRVQCDGLLCRSVTLESENASYEVPMMELDEMAFRRAIVEHTDLDNTCVRLNLDRLGVCPCEVEMKTGCVACILGIALILSVVGALLGTVVLTVGLLFLLIAFVSRKFNKWRGANVWE